MKVIRLYLYYNCLKVIDMTENKIKGEENE